MTESVWQSSTEISLSDAMCLGSAISLILLHKEGFFVFCIFIWARCGMWEEVPAKKNHIESVISYKMLNTIKMLRGKANIDYVAKSYGSEHEDEIPDAESHTDSSSSVHMVEYKNEIYLLRK